MYKEGTVLKVLENHRLLGQMLIGVGVFNVFDYFLTLYAIGQGLREGNPVMNAILHTAYFPIVKLILVPLALLFVWHMRNTVGHRITYYVWILFLAYTALIFYYTWLFWNGYL